MVLTLDPQAVCMHTICLQELDSPCYVSQVEMKSTI
jgi:hypothetical protein